MSRYLSFMASTKPGTEFEKARERVLEKAGASWAVVIIVQTRMERESGEAMRSGPIEVIRRVPAPATRDQTEGEVVGGVPSISSFGGGGTTGGVASGGDTFEGLASGLGHLEWWILEGGR